MSIALIQNTVDFNPDRTPVMKWLKIGIWSLIIGGVVVGSAGLSNQVSAAQQSSELARQAQTAQANTEYITRVCKMYQRRDASILRHNAVAVAINNTFSDRLPAGYAKAINDLISVRDADIVSIEKADCGPHPATSAAATP